ncbi:MAG: hypothetical protein Q8R55_01920 [Candidatus Taylorbacteria bacterium]|nr:hypothetical protein [Candidatus Taylorbacteria bacterium]
MLKNIGNILEKRKAAILRTEDKTSQIKKSLQYFMKNRFGDSLAGFSLRISYETKNNKLVIATENKILANEMALLLTDIHQHLKRDGIAVSSILIR